RTDRGDLAVADQEPRVLAVERLARREDHARGLDQDGAILRRQRRDSGECQGRRDGEGAHQRASWTVRPPAITLTIRASLDSSGALVTTRSASLSGSSEPTRSAMPRICAGVSVIARSAASA